MQVSNVSFTGIPISKYSATLENSKPCEILIYKIEAKDKIFLKKLLKKAQQEELISPDLAQNQTRIKKRDYTNFCYELIKNSVNDMLSLFKIKDKLKCADSSIKYLAVVDKKPCGILVGNIPKITPDLKKIVFSNRGKGKETELDWLVTWKQKGEEKASGIGRTLLAEFFNEVSKLKNTNSIYVRSSLERVSNAKKLYTRNGFRPTSQSFIDYENESRPTDITRFIKKERHKNIDFPVIPLQMKTKNALASFEQTAKTLNRQALPQESLDLLETLTI